MESAQQDTGGAARGVQRQVSEGVSKRGAARAM